MSDEKDIEEVWREIRQWFADKHDAFVAARLLAAARARVRDVTQRAVELLGACGKHRDVTIDEIAAQPCPLCAAKRIAELEGVIARERAL